MKNPIPLKATHPGSVLKDELNARKIKQKDFAKEINMLATAFNEIIKEKRPISPDLAIILEKALDIEASFWVNMQANYDLDVARIKEKNVKKVEILEIWNTIKQYVPINIFKKLGYIIGSPENDIPVLQKIWEDHSYPSLVLGSYSSHP